MLIGSAPVLKGAIGLVKYSYRTVATVTRFQVSRDPETKAWSLRGTCVGADTGLLAERPLRFVVATKKGAWTWPVESVTVAGLQLTARLGVPS